MERKEHLKRSLLKTITFRMISIVVLFSVTWLLTGNMFEATAITIVFQSIQTVVYFVHEHIWERKGRTE